MDRPLHLCIYENRLNYSPCLQVVLLSVRDRLPGATVHLFDNPLVSSLRDWIANLGIPYEIYPNTFPSLGWSIKPFLIARLLDAGLPEVVWLDADTVVLRDFRPWLQAQPADGIVVTEEINCPFNLNSGRAQVWGDAAVRSLPLSVNSCVLRITAAHRAMLADWCTRIGDPRYSHAQSLPAADRPRELFGDQDVLEGLLVGRYARFPVTILKSGPEIIQEFWMHDYRLSARIKNAFGLQHPYILHAQGPKSWELLQPGAPAHVLREYRAVGAYASASRRYAATLGEGCRYWLYPTGWFPRASRWLTGGNLHLEGAPLQLRDYLAGRYRRLKSWMKSLIVR